MTKRLKYAALSSSLLTFTLLLSGCMRLDDSGNPTGLFSELVYNYLVIPAEATLDWLASTLGNYGFAIIALTILVRVIILPFTLKQQSSMMEQQIKMARIKPIIDDIQARMKQATDPEKKQMLQAELMTVYKENDINIVGQVAGCLPIFFQMPIFIAVFHVFRSSEAIAQTEFFGVALGETSILLAGITVVLYYLQAKLMNPTPTSSDTPNPAGGMTLMMPIMMGVFSYTSPAGLALYFMVSAVVGIVQQYYINSFFKPKIQADLDEKYGDQPTATPPSASFSTSKKTSKHVTNTSKSTNVPPVNQKRRNAGKQHSS